MIFAVPRPRVQFQIPALLGLFITAVCGVPAHARSAPPAATRTASAPAAAEADLRLAIAGFEAAPGTDARDLWLPIALEELLNARFRRVSGVDVVQVQRLYATRRELADDQTLPDWQRVAPAIGAQWLLTGVCGGTPYQTTVRLTLSALGGGATPVSIDIPAGRLFEVLNAATSWVAEQLGVSATPAATPQLFSDPSSSLSAVQFYSRAVAAARQQQWEEAMSLCAASLESDGYFRLPIPLLAQIHMQRGADGFADAQRLLQTLSTNARMANDVVDRGRAELGLATLHLLTGATDAALTRCEMALALANVTEDAYDQIQAMNGLRDVWLARRLLPGTPITEAQQIAFVRENFTRAAEWQNLSLDLAAALGDSVEELQAANKLAQIYEKLNDPDGAYANHRRVFDVATRLKSRKNMATAWLFLSGWFRERQRWNEALDAANQALALTDPNASTTIRLLLGEIYKGMSAPAEALAQFEQVLTAVRKSEDLSSQFVCLTQIAALQNQLTRRAEAIRTMKEAIDLAHALELPEEPKLREQLKEWEAQK